VPQENHTSRMDSDTYDIYLLPPGEDVETCTSWLRMRNRDGRYNLMFEEWVTDGPFIISPRITFEVRHLCCSHALSDASSLGNARWTCAGPLHGPAADTSTFLTSCVASALLAASKT
jgi:hypothetical protein